MKKNEKNGLSSNSENYISFLDILAEFSRNLKLITIIIAFFLLLSIIVAIFRQTMYTSSATVFADLNEGSEMRLSSGLNALKSLGINTGISSSGLIPDTYPKIIKSREVLYEVIHTSFYFSNLDSTMTFVDYITYKDFTYYLKKYTIRLPFTLYRIILPKNRYKKMKSTDGEILHISEKENSAISALAGNIISSDIDLETGLISISATTINPNLSAQINETVLQSFRNMMRNMYDQKNSENLKFIKERLDETKQELTQSEQAVIKFLESNSNPGTIQLSTELERLKRDVTFKAQLFSELQIQFMQTEIDLKKNEPVIRIIERPSPPINPSGMGRFNIIILFLFMGLLTGFVIVLIRFIITNLKQDKISQQKMENIKTDFSSFFKFRVFTLKRNKK